MNPIAKDILWQIIREKIEKGEPVTTSMMTWGVITGGFTVSKDTLSSRDNVNSLKKELDKLLEEQKKDDAALKAEYDEKKAAHRKEIEESKAFFEKIQKQFKTVKSEVNKTKIDKNIKTGVIGLMQEYLERLDSEIRIEANFPLFEEWKKDRRNVIGSQIPFVQNNLKNKEKEASENEKLLSKIESELPFPKEMIKDDTSKSGSVA